ncbi:MAG TPA: hypothetical protein VIU12_08135 [Chryseolinea sp.]
MMEIPTELLTNIFTVAVGFILLAILGLLVALLVHTVRMEKAVDESIARKKVAQGQQSARKEASLLVKHS